MTTTAATISRHAAMVGMGVDLADLPEYAGCNDLGTAVLLAAMARAGVGRLVLASSMVVYDEGAYTCIRHGRTRPAARAVADLAAGRFEPRCPACAAPLAPDLVDEDARLDPRSVYAATKVAQEHLAAAWAHASGGSVVALRYHNVYGPRMPRDTPYAGVAAIFRSALERGAAPRVFEDGGQRRDFVHVGDVARANLAALHATEGGAGLRAYNIASGRPQTVGEMAAALSAAFGGPPPVVTGEFRAGDVRHIVASPTRAAHHLGFTANVAFDRGIAEFATAPLRGSGDHAVKPKRIGPQQRPSREARAAMGRGVTNRVPMTKTPRDCGASQLTRSSPATAGGGFGCRTRGRHRSRPASAWWRVPAAEPTTASPYADSLPVACA